MIYVWLYFLGLCSIHFLRQPRIKVIEDGCGEPYLIRFSLIHFLGFALKLHVIIRSDAERELHSHPWSFWSYMISGAYVEEVADNPKSFKHGNETSKHWVDRGTLRFCKVPHPHRIDLFCQDYEGYKVVDNTLKRFKPAITCVLTYPKSRPWGFYGKNGFIPHHAYRSEDC